MISMRRGTFLATVTFVAAFIPACQRSDLDKARVEAIEKRVRELEHSAKSDSRPTGESKRDAELRARIDAIEKQLKDLDENFSDSDLRWSKEIGRLQEDVQRVLSESTTKRTIENVSQRASADLEGLKKELQGGGITLLEKEGRIEATGTICQNEVLVEWMMVCKGGKTHESMVLLDGRPSLLNAALLAIGLRPGKGAYVIPTAKDNPPGGTPIEEGFTYYPPQGDRVHVYMEWTDEGKTIRRRPEECILNTETNKPADFTGWVYLGSRFARLEPNGNEVFVADVTRDVASIWHSFEGNAVLDYPGLDGRDDHIHYPLREKLPPKGSPVKLLFCRNPL